MNHPTNSPKSAASDHARQCAIEPLPQSQSCSELMEAGESYARKSSPIVARKSRKRVKSRAQAKPPPSTTSSSAVKHDTALIKYGSLALLVGQMTGLVMLMRYSRTHADGELYLASTAVFMMEITKLCLCLSVIFYQSGGSLRRLGAEVYNHVWASPHDMLKLCVPSFAYTIQNNLLYLALTNLDAASYQVLYQTKILTTAVFTTVLLGRRFSKTKWASLVVLTCGVAMVQISGISDHEPSEDDDRNRLLGLVAVLSAACLSGFSGVYFEKILKGKGKTNSVWIRNVQMGLSSVMVALVTVYVSDSEAVRRKGFFVGYSPMVVSVIAVQAVGGLIVAVVVKYADNVLKTFAASFSILLSCIISAFAFDFRPDRCFSGGVCLVMLSTALYSKPTEEKRKALQTLSHK